MLGGMECCGSDGELGDLSVVGGGVTVSYRCYTVQCCIIS